MDIHNLAKEFPEYKETIHNLKMNDAHFRNLFERFEVVDKAIVRAESRIDLISDEQENFLRKERMKIKDEIYSILKEHQA